MHICIICLFKNCFEVFENQIKIQNPAIYVTFCLVDKRTKKCIEYGNLPQQLPIFLW